MSNYDTAQVLKIQFEDADHFFSCSALRLVLARGALSSEVAATFCTAVKLVRCLVDLLYRKRLLTGRLVDLTDQFAFYPHWQVNFQASLPSRP
jgi:hypothetical protein